MQSRWDCETFYNKYFKNIFVKENNFISFRQACHNYCLILWGGMNAYIANLKKEIKSPLDR